MNTPPAPRWWQVLAGVGMLLLIVSAIAYYWAGRQPRPDMVAVMHVNNKGVGLMERFEYERAAEAFEEVTRLAPDWLPGHINLGIALLNAGGNTSAKRQARQLDGGGGDLTEAITLFEDILKKDSKNPYGHYCLGILLKYRNEPEQAAGHFRSVTEIDPGDAHAWYFLGDVCPPGSEARRRAFEKALEHNPYLSGAIYGLAMELRQQDLKEARRLLQSFEKLKATGSAAIVDLKYSQMGRYATVIGKSEGVVGDSRSGPLPLFARYEAFAAELASGTRWAAAADLGADPEADLRREVRKRFGAVVAVLDYDRDGKLDLLLLGAVVQDGRVRDLLLHQEGQDTFRDVTATVGLGGGASLGCCVADFDNDGYPDLVLTGVGRQRLFRNVKSGDGGRRFEEVTKAAGLDKLSDVCLGATFLDLDNDGDLDLVVARYAATAEAALATLRGHPRKEGPGLAVYLNVGTAPPNAGEAPAPLAARFRRVEDVPELVGGPVHAITQALSDLDCDRDVDLLVLADGAAPSAVLNDRLMRFHRIALPEALVGQGKWNGALVLDCNHDERPDLFLIGPGHRPLLLLNKPGTGPADVRDWFQAGLTDSPPLLQAQASDVDLDGWTDVVGLSEQRRPVLLHNDGRKLVAAAEAFGRDNGWAKDLIGLAVADVDSDGHPDLLVWSEAAGLQFYRSQGNGHHALRLELSGLRDPKEGVRCNADALGAWAVAQVGGLWTGAELATVSAGLGQSRQPLLLGLRRHAVADVVRVRWPDGTWQAELSVPTNQPVQVRETNRMPISCPLLFAWDGRRFGFIADFLGAGSLGEPLPEGGHRPPRPEESVKIESGQLTAKDGRYLLKIAEPMDEVTYLDKLQLLVVDHPRDICVYPDERFAAGAQGPTQDLLAFDARQKLFPVSARDHRGRDVTEALRRWDRNTVDGFACRSWLGFAEEHWVELDFGDRLAHFGARDRLLLCLAGWTAYPYPESIWAATQAGVSPQPPVLERLGEDGRWQTISTAVGFPAGLPRMCTFDASGKLGGPRCVLRLRTNMQIYWDQVFVAPLLERVAAGRHQGKLFRVTGLEVQEAMLQGRGCVQEFSPDGRRPVQYDHDRLERVPVSRLAGRLTRFGDVTQLLRQRDDQFVIFGPGDEVAVAFYAGGPSLLEGWTRSFVLRTWGYCKDAAPFTATGGTVEPLPFAAMTRFPYGPEEQYPRSAAHERYRRGFNTRQIGAKGSPR